MPRLLPICLFAFLSVSTAFAAPQVPPAAPTKVCSAIVYDLENDAILFEQNADERIPPASLTKVMSMFIALDYIKAGHAAKSDMIRISPLAAGESGSRMGLKPNESVSFEKLLFGMAVSSGNDASFAVAEHVGGSAEAFVKMMNARAKQLGMSGSNFANPHGLPAAGQYTTARDMAALARAYLLAHPDAMEFHNTRTLTHGGYTSWNKNPLLGQYPGANGLKTGWIRASGYNLIFTAQRGKQRLLAVIMGAPDVYLRSAEACRLLDAGFMVCDNQEVSVAAALDTLPLDLARIDPLKTGRDNGLLKKRAVASKSAKARRLAANSRLAKRAGKALAAKRMAQQRTISTKARAGGKAHAERKSPRARRS